MTGQVTVSIHGIITKAAMIWKMFVGQSVNNLTNWLERVSDGDVKVYWLSDEGVIPVNSRSELRRFAHHAEKTE
jgi:hypothetical protein